MWKDCGVICSWWKQFRQVLSSGTDACWHFPAFAQYIHLWRTKTTSLNNMTEIQIMIISNYFFWMNKAVIIHTGPNRSFPCRNCWYRLKEWNYHCSQGHSEVQLQVELTVDSNDACVKCFTVKLCVSLLEQHSPAELWEKKSTLLLLWMVTEAEYSTVISRCTSCIYCHTESESSVQVQQRLSAYVRDSHITLKTEISNHCSELQLWQRNTTRCKMSRRKLIFELEDRLNK